MQHPHWKKIQKKTGKRLLHWRAWQVSLMLVKHLNMRLQLYKCCLVPSILYNLEGWHKISITEIKSLKQIQATTPCCSLLLQLSKSALYGLLNEVGMWRMEKRLIYRKIMLYCNILVSPNNLLVKQIIKKLQDDDFPC